MNRRWLFLAVFALGCSDPLSEAQRIERTRVIGARVEAGGDPSRAWPRPGESASVRFWVADPRPAPALGWDLRACLAAPTSRGLPECDSPPFAQSISPALGPELPAIDFAVPDEARERVLVIGAICGDGQPTLEAPLEKSHCDGDLTLVALLVELEREASGNSNPTLGDEGFSFDGADWPAPSEALTLLSDCTSADEAPELPLVSSGSGPHRIRVTASADDRDSGEELWLSHFSTAGRLDRPLSVVDDAVEVGWKAPGAVDGGGRLVRFYFVLRDLRGGADFALRTACAVP